MASPDKDSQYIVVSREHQPNEDFPTLDAAEAAAKERTKLHGKVHTVFQAVSEYEIQETPVKRTAYRQAASRKAGE